MKSNVYPAPPSHKSTTTRNNLKQTDVVKDRCRYLFVDSNEHHADRILTGAMIPSTFHAIEGEDTRLRTLDHNDGQPNYELRLCSFDARYEQWFLCCMADLEWVLAMDESYRDACEKLLGAPAVISSARSELARQRGTSKPYAPAPGLRRMALMVADI